MIMSTSVRSARRQFSKEYGQETFSVISRILKGWNSKRIADSLHLPISVVAAYAANLTRGTYEAFVYKTARGFSGPAVNS